MLLLSISDDLFMSNAESYTGLQIAKHFLIVNNNNINNHSNK